MNVETLGKVMMEASDSAWSASGASSVLILMVAVFTSIFGNRLRAKWRFALWCLVVIRLLLPVAPESPLSLFNLPKILRSTSEPRVETAAVVASDAIQISTENAALPGAPSIPTDGLRLRRKVNWLGNLAMIWIIGTLTLGLRMVAGAVWLRWWMGLKSEPVSGNTLALFESAARKIGNRSKCRLTISRQVRSPALFGLLRPTLLIPAGFEQLTHAAQEFVFLHELAHLKRKDLITNFLMNLAQAIHWWNPLVWLAMRQMRLEREIACDEMVVSAISDGRTVDEKARDYGRTILRLIEGAGQKKLAVVGIAEDKRSVRKRLEHLSNFSRSRTAGRLASSVILLVVAVSGLTNAQNPAKPGKTESFEQIGGATGVQAQVERLLRDARALLEQAKLNEAEQCLIEANKLAPQHTEVATMLFSLKEKRFAQESPKPESPGIDSGGGNRLVKNERTFTSSGRQAIVKKLLQIRIDHYDVPNPLPLSEIIKDLYATARKSDPEKKGVNFVFSSRLENSGIIGSVPTDDPLTGSAPLKVGDYLVTISPALRDVTLHGLLDAIMEVAEPPKTHTGAPPLRYAIEEYAVVIGLRRYEPEPLYTRTFKIDPNTFTEGLDQTFGTGIIQAPNGLTPIQRAVRNLMVNAGVDFGTNTGSSLRQSNDGQSPTEKALFFNDRTGVLMARATLHELNLVEKVLQNLQSRQPLQIAFTVEAVEVPTPVTLQEFIKSLKFIGEFRTRLTDPEYRELRRLTVPNFKWITLPKVTTVSGRAARVEIEKDFSVDLLGVVREADEPIKLNASSHDAARPKRELKEAMIYDGQTVALMPFADNESVSPPRIILITPILIDPAGNRVNSTESSFFEKTLKSFP